MKLVMAAFWVEEDRDVDKAMDIVCGETMPGINGSGAVVSFSEDEAQRPEFKRTLARFDLQEAAYFKPKVVD